LLVVNKWPNAVAIFASTDIENGFDDNHKVRDFP
jgi:hypothetical protein